MTVIKLGVCVCIRTEHFEKSGLRPTQQYNHSHLEMDSPPPLLQTQTSSMSLRFLTYATLVIHEKYLII